MVELKNYELQWAKEFAKIRNDAEVLQFAYDSVPYPFLEEHAQDWIEEQLVHDPARRLLIFWNNELAGEIGISLGADIFRLNAEIGYFVAKKFWSRGIASQAIGLMTEYIFKNFEVLRINAGVMEPNKGSMRALEKNGYLLESIRKQEVIKNNIVMTNHHFVRFRNP